MVRKQEYFIFASYIKSRENVVSDYESRSLNIETKYELNSDFFAIIVKELGGPNIDLFASRINRKCRDYVSWRPDPGSIAVDDEVGRQTNYAFPPFAIISKVIDKIIVEGAEEIVVVPNWSNQPWHPLFNRLLIGRKIILGPARDLLLFLFRDPHPNYRHFTLVARKLFGKLIGGGIFLKRGFLFYQRHCLLVL